MNLPEIGNDLVKITMEDVMENKRVVFINGDSSSWFEQAIVIVKDGQKHDCFESGRPTPNLVEQAERIVNGYNPFKAYQNFAPRQITANPVSRGTGASKAAVSKKSSAPGKSFDMMLNVVMLVGCVVLAGMLMTQL